MEKIYTVKEAAKILGFSTNTLYKYLDNGAIEAARGVGKQARFRIPHSSIEKFLNTPLTEEHVLKVLNPAEYAREQSLTATPVTPVPARLPATQFPVVVSRLLLIGALIFMILDLILSTDFSLPSTVFRMGLITVFVLLAYQFGGYTKSR